MPVPTHFRRLLALLFLVSLVTLSACGSEHVIFSRSGIGSSGPCG
jgi:hypothetical protein